MQKDQTETFTFFLTCIQMGKHLIDFESYMPRIITIVEANCKFEPNISLQSPFNNLMKNFSAIKEIKEETTPSFFYFDALSKDNQNWRVFIVNDPDLSKINSHLLDDAQNISFSIETGLTKLHDKLNDDEKPVKSSPNSTKEEQPSRLDQSDFKRDLEVILIKLQNTELPSQGLIEDFKGIDCDKLLMKFIENPGDELNKKWIRMFSKNISDNWKKGGLPKIRDFIRKYPEQFEFQAENSENNLAKSMPLSKTSTFSKDSDDFSDFNRELKSTIEKIGNLKLHSPGLKRDYGDINYKQLLEKFLESPYDRINQRWIKSFSEPASDEWRNGGLSHIKNLIRQYPKQFGYLTGGSIKDLIKSAPPKY